MRSIRRTEARSAYRSAISAKYEVIGRAGECEAFVEPKHEVLTALPSLQKLWHFLNKLGVTALKTKSCMPYADSFYILSNGIAVVN